MLSYSLKSKYLLIICILFLSPYRLYSQDLTFNELLKIRSQSYEDINEYLGAKSWRFISIDENSDETKTITWAYAKSYDKAKSWIKQKYNNTETQILLYQISNIKTINSIKLQMKSHGFKKSPSEIYSNMISTKYENNFYIVILTSVPETENELSKYIVTIENKKPIERPKTSAKKETKYLSKPTSNFQSSEEEVESVSMDLTENKSINIPDKYECIGRSTYYLLELYEKPDRNSNKIGENTISPLSDKFYVLQRRLFAEGCNCWDYVYVNGFWGYTLSSWITCD